MSRIAKYQEGIIKFLKTKSFINDTTPETKKILNEMIENTQHIPAILCLTILNNQCKKNDVKIHGYYLASGIDILMLVSRICNNKSYYDNKYGGENIDNMISEVVCFFYKSLSQNIDTLRMSKNGNISPKILQLCIEYTSKNLPNIIMKQTYNTTDKMKKTDILCMNLDDDLYKEYKKKRRIGKDSLDNNTLLRYGSVCKLALCLGWIIGCGDEAIINKTKNQDIIRLENLADNIGKYLKIHDDFIFIERDMKTIGVSNNYVINCGIKEAHMEFTEAKAKYIEGSMILDTYTKTTKEIIDLVDKDVENILHDISVDMNTHYDDVSTQ